MTDQYHYVNKPSDATYSYPGFQGKQTYDQFDLTYDDVNTYYDSVNPNAYTTVAKSTDSTYTYIAKPTN